VDHEWFEAQITKIRTAIASDGTFVATAEEITILCHEHSFDAQFRALVRLAQRERWIFTFFPDRRVEIRSF
jgi:hypothetical protein